MCAVVVLLAALLLPSSFAQPIGPSYSAPLFWSQTAINEVESVAPRAILAVNGAATKMLQNASGIATPGDEAGWYATITRADTSSIYLLWRFNDTVQCRGYQKSSSIPIPFSIFAPYQRSMSSLLPDASLTGAFANFFGSNVNRYRYGFMIESDAAQRFAAHFNALFDGLSPLTTDFHVGVPDAVPYTPESMFDPPSHCTALHMGHVEAELHEAFAARTSPSRWSDPERRAANTTPSPLSLSRAQRYYARLPDHYSLLRSGRAPRFLRQAAPRFVDNRPFAPSVRSQGPCGACWAFSSVAAAEVVFYKHRNDTSCYNAVSSAATLNSCHFSVQNVIDCASGTLNGSSPIEAKGCQGGWPLTALTYIATEGIARDGDYRYQGVTELACVPPPASQPPRVRLTSGGLAIPPQRIDLIESAIATWGAVTAIIGVPIDLLSFSGGTTIDASGFAVPRIFNSSTCVETFAHGVVIVGYGETPKGQAYWIVKNSFGPSWSEAGYVYMAKGVNMCGIEAWVTAVHPPNA